MDNKQLSDLITREVDKAIEADFSKIDSTSFKVLGIMTHMGKGLEQLCKTLIQLSREGLPVLVWTHKEIDNIIQIKSQSNSVPTMKVELGNDGNFCFPNLKGLKYIIFGAFSFEIADKIIQLQDEDPIVNVLIQGLLLNLPVYILTPIPLTDLIFEYKPTSRINQELRKRLSLLTEIGFGLLDEKDLEDSFIKQIPSTPDLITESYIEELRGKVRELRLPRKAIVTPLAQEKAGELKIRIVRI